MPWPTSLSSAAAWCPTAGTTCWSRRPWAKPVFAGPHLFNFLDIAAQLRDAGALLEVTDAGELLRRPRAPVGAAGGRDGHGHCRKKVLRNNQGALERLLAGLARLLGRGG